MASLSHKESLSFTARKKYEYVPVNFVTSDKLPLFYKLQFPSHANRADHPLCYGLDGAMS